MWGGSQTNRSVVLSYCKDQIYLPSATPSAESWVEFGFPVNVYTAKKKCVVIALDVY